VAKKGHPFSGYELLRQTSADVLPVRTDISKRTGANAIPHIPPSFRIVTTQHASLDSSCLKPWSAWTDTGDTHG